MKRKHVAAIKARQKLPTHEPKIGGCATCIACFQDAFPAPMEDVSHGFAALSTMAAFIQLFDKEQQFIKNLMCEGHQILFQDALNVWQERNLLADRGEEDAFVHEVRKALKRQRGLQ